MFLVRSHTYCVSRCAKRNVLEPKLSSLAAMTPTSQETRMYLLQCTARVCVAQSCITVAKLTFCLSGCLRRENSVNIHQIYRLRPPHRPHCCFKHFDFRDSDRFVANNHRFCVLGMVFVSFHSISVIATRCLPLNYSRFLTEQSDPHIYCTLTPSILVDTRNAACAPLPRGACRTTRASAGSACESAPVASLDWVRLGKALWSRAIRRY